MLEFFKSRTEGGAGLGPGYRCHREGLLTQGDGIGVTDRGIDGSGGEHRCHR
jgi:hypothetical protein